MLSHLVSPLAVCFVGGVGLTVQTARYLKGFDVLGCAQSAGSLGNDAGQSHLFLHINLGKRGKLILVQGYSTYIKPNLI